MESSSRWEGFWESATGPGGRDGYVHIEDAVEILRMEELRSSEIAVRVRSSEGFTRYSGDWKPALGELNKKGNPVFEVHTWERYRPFTTSPA